MEYPLRGSPMAWFYLSFILSVQVLGKDLDSWEKFKSENPPPVVYQSKCLECHQYSDAPRIPIDDLSELKKKGEFFGRNWRLIDELEFRIDPNTDSYWSMPIGNNLESEDRETLNKYFNSIQEFIKAH